VPEDEERHADTEHVEDEHGAGEEATCRSGRCGADEAAMRKIARMGVANVLDEELRVRPMPKKSRKKMTTGTQT